MFGGVISSAAQGKLRFCLLNHVSGFMAKNVENLSDTAWTVMVMAAVAASGFVILRRMALV